ncbi:PepSY-associated TM helix domain-containing protein [Neobacillus rhizophilus]|uniref:PepSY domain-containing protein n=1 Tax=Neobacillus rhizophilus TaxID=2833579 RepID=A0A942UBK8_9BACI|nr:PepSY-associated TM helix domain-containing protein [Neobacillus rhizophilus]MBS4216272.1 PepSY domain-containing protein [Neobacillus rhizophilus]MBU8917167.1 PepSY domain-containing protein [Bacillus sp. FJAT-29953]
MKKVRKTHLWIGLIASVLIFMESLTGLLMNEPWLIGQTQMGERGNFQPGQFRQGFTNGAGQTQGGFNRQMDGQAGDNNQGQTNGQFGNQMQGQDGNQMQGQNRNGQFQGGAGRFNGNGNFTRGFRGEGIGQTSAMGIIRGLHEGRIGNTDVKWLIDLTAIAMMFLTGSGIYLSLKVLGAERKRKRREEDPYNAVL